MKPLADERTLERLRRSVERCLAEPLFLKRFYARFLLTSDEAADKFRGTDMNKQARMLRASLFMMLRAAEGKDDGLQHLQEIAASHGRSGHDIPPKLYEHWLASLVATAAETDPQFDQEVEEAWYEGLRPCVQAMAARYDE